MEPPFNYFFNDRTNPITIEAVTGGPLAAALEAYAQRLHDDGYATHSGFLQLRVLGCFNHWLDREALTAGDVSLATIEQFLRGRRQRGKLRKGDAAALRRLLTMLDPNPFPVAVSSPSAIEVWLKLFRAPPPVHRTRFTSTERTLPLAKFTEQENWKLALRPRPCRAVAKPLMKSFRPGLLSDTTWRNVTFRKPSR